MSKIKPPRVAKENRRVPQSVKFNIISLRNFAPSLPYSAVIRLLIQPRDIMKQIIFNH